MTSSPRLCSSPSRSIPTARSRYGTVLQMKNLLFNIMIWQGSVASYGGNWMDADGNITVDSEAYRKALDIYKKITDGKPRRATATATNMPRPTAPSAPARSRSCVQWSAAYAEFDRTPSTIRRSPASSTSPMSRPAPRGRRPTSTPSASASTRRPTSRTRRRHS